MREIIELRIPEDEAKKILAADEGTPIGWQGEQLGHSVRKVTCEMDSDLYSRIVVAHRKSRRKRVIFGWDIRRSYTPAELKAARAFVVDFTKTFEPSAESYGTKYDESAMCPQCGAGRTPILPLILDLTNGPKGADVARTIADEWVASERFVDLVRREKWTGVRFVRVTEARPSRRERASPWYSFSFVSAPATIGSQTKFGVNPFDDVDDDARCPVGHTLGLNLLSQVCLSSWSGKDFVVTREMLGVRRGLLNPRPLLVVSQRVREVLAAEKIKGWRFEVALTPEK